MVQYPDSRAIYGSGDSIQYNTGIWCRVIDVIHLELVDIRVKDVELHRIPGGVEGGFRQKQCQQLILSMIWFQKNPECFACGPIYI